MTNHSELRAAAEQYRNYILPNGHPEKGFCAWNLDDIETARRKRDEACMAMATHILATVRDDDADRAAFEARATRLEVNGTVGLPLIVCLRGDYAYQVTEIAWQAWRASQGRE